MVEYKSIKVTKQIYDRLVEDKKHFTKVIGYNFNFSSTINEYHKIMNRKNE